MRRWLCRLGLHRRYVAQRNYGVDPNTPTLVIKLCRRHCGWADVKPNYKPPA